MTYSGEEGSVLPEQWLAAPPLETPLVPAAVGRILMAVLELYKRDSTAALPLHRVSPATAQVSVLL